MDCVGNLFRGFGTSKRITGGEGGAGLGRRVIRHRLALIASTDKQGVVMSSL
jgi:hypothetical protein